jgi:hypothetical protein
MAAAVGGASFWGAYLVGHFSVAASETPHVGAGAPLSQVAAASNSRRRLDTEEDIDMGSGSSVGKLVGVKRKMESAPGVAPVEGVRGRARRL